MAHLREMPRLFRCPAIPVRCSDTDGTVPTPLRALLFAVGDTYSPITDDRVIRQPYPIPIRAQVENQRPAIQIQLHSIWYKQRMRRLFARDQILSHWAIQCEPRGQTDPPPSAAHAKHFRLQVSCGRPVELNGFRCEIRRPKQLTHQHSCDTTEPHQAAQEHLRTPGHGNLDLATQDATGDGSGGLWLALTRADNAER